MDEKREDSEYVLRLFVSGSSPNSMRAIRNIQKFLEEHLKGKYKLNIIDLYKERAMAKEEQIVALPLLIKKFPLPERRLVGDMSNIKKVREGLGLIAD